MDIEKGKISEIWNNHKVVLYTQKIINKDINETVNICAEDINSLLNKVRKQVNDWK